MPCTGMGDRHHGERMKHIAGVFIVVAMILAGAPSSGWAQWREFVPTFVFPGADLSVTAAYSSTKSLSGGSVKSDNFNAGEILTLHVRGYSYDPRFILFGLSFGLGLRQQYESTTIASGGWRTGEAKEYRFDMIVLKNHPYNLHLYAYSTEPLIVGTNTESPRTQTGKGAQFRYKKKPYFFNASYTTISYDTSLGSSTSDALSASALYLKQYASGNSLSFAGDYTRRSFSSPSASHGTANYYFFTNSADFRPVRLSSSIARDDNDQRTSTGLFSTGSWDWREGLSVSLPLNFTAGFSWDYRKNTTTAEQTATPDRRLSGTAKDISFNINHTLYKSLDSYYTFSRSWLSSSSGDTEQTSHHLSFSYRKIIPWGRLTSALSFQRFTFGNSGEAQIVNEPHTAVSVPGYFTLSQQEPDEATIRVYVRYPVEPFEIFELEEGVHYTVIPVGNTFQIDIISLPPAFIPPGAFDFFVSYAIRRSEFKTETNSLGYNINFNLFDNLLSPYYSYSTTSSKILSGALPGGAQPLEATSHTVGLVVHKEPFRATLQYQNTASNVNSNTAWRGEIGYDKALDTTERIFATASYGIVNYHGGTSAPSALSYSQHTAVLSANLVKRLPDRGMTLTAGGSFSFLKSLTTSTAYSLNSSLSWIVGKLTVSAGASLSLSESEGGKGLHVSTLHQYYYLNVKRKIF
jgi:hypothetical protein